MSEVSLIDVSRSFGPVRAARNVTLTVPDGAFVVLDPFQQILDFLIPCRNGLCLLGNLAFTLLRTLLELLD